MTAPAWTAGAAVPGSDRTDTMNALWSLWAGVGAVAAGDPLRSTLLDYPHGGTLLTADLLGLLTAGPLVGPLGVDGAYTALIALRIAAAGLAMEAFARALLRRRGVEEPWAPLFAGVAFALSPIAMAFVHNGSAELTALMPVPLCGYLALRLIGDARPRWVIAMAGGLLLAALASFYTLLAAGLLAAGLLLMAPGSRGPRLLGLLLGALLVAPWALTVHRAATATDNLVGIKNPRELHLVRRTTGPADPRSYLLGGEFRSPDFRQISRYGEDFLHAPYLGVVLLGGALLVLRRRDRPGTGGLWVAGGAGLLFSLGPVLVFDASPFLFADQRGVPLPYFLIERLPGFSSLSLLWRLGLAAVVAGHALLAIALAGRPLRQQLLVLAAILAEGQLLAPSRGLPGAASTAEDPALVALAAAPKGAVINFPVVGGRGYLFEQTVHGKPLAATLNFPNNDTGQRVWAALIAAEGQGSAAFVEAADRIARQTGVRYLVVHKDAEARPDQHDRAVVAVQAALSPLAGDPAASAIVVYSLRRD